MPGPTRFPNGIADPRGFTSGGVMGAARSQFYNWPALDPTRYTTYFDDFTKFTAADWTITKVGTGTTALTTTTVTGGNLLITNSAANADSVYLQAVGNAFKYTLGKRLLFKARLKVDQATLAGIVMGLTDQDTTPGDVNNGFHFSKTGASATLVGNTEASNTASTVNVGTVVADTYFTCGILIEPRQGSVQFFFNDILVGSTALTNAPSALLSPNFGVLNGSAVIRIMTVDYILVSMEN